MIICYTQAWHVTCGVTSAGLCLPCVWWLAVQGPPPRLQAGGGVHPHRVGAHKGRQGLVSGRGWLCWRSVLCGLCCWHQDQGVVACPQAMTVLAPAIDAGPQHMHMVSLPVQQPVSRLKCDRQHRAAEDACVADVCAGVAAAAGRCAWALSATCCALRTPLS